MSTWISLWICREYVHRQSDSRGWVSRRDSKTNGTPNFSLSSTEAHPTPSRPSAGISPILSLTWAIAQCYHNGRDVAFFLKVFAVEV